MDMLIHTDTKEKHLELLEVISKKLEKGDITFNKSKCVFCVKKIDFLGHVISQKEIQFLCLDHKLKLN